jgi:hypothetical protein
MTSDQTTSSNMSLEDQIAQLTQTVQSNRGSLDDATRFKALTAARGLLEALESPPETVIRDVVLVCQRSTHILATCSTDPLPCVAKIKLIKG